MKEEDYKKLRCIGPCPENTGILDIETTTEPKIIYRCSGSQCAGWVWINEHKDGRMAGGTQCDGRCGYIR